MPEGDILRRTAAQLDTALAGRVLVRAELRWPSAAGVDLVGRMVLGTRPYGKHLLTRLDDGRTVRTHLRMDGSWRVRRAADQPLALHRPEIRAVLASDAGLAVGYLLGMLDVVRTRDEHTLVGTLGPDLLDDTFDPGDGPGSGIPPGRSGPLGIDAPGGMPAKGDGAGIDETLRRFAARGATPVAEVLLDQHVVAGIGTIFMAESLFVERLWPWMPADTVPDPARLLRTARRLMAESVRVGAPPGRVHARERLRCVRCGTLIARGQARAAPMQRPVFWCPRCQSAPRG
ncbi:MAG TPA: DNA-formamidopyrimidine glycosylase family protein [Cellulomonas sp.]